MRIRQKPLQHLWLMALFLVLVTNVSLYHTPLGNKFLSGVTNGVVIGSMIDLGLVSPVLFCIWRGKWGWKDIIISTAAGLMLIRFLIPMALLAPFEAITWVGFMIEGLFILFEVLVIVTLFKYIPEIIHTVKRSSVPTIFSFPEAVHHKVRKNYFIQVVCSEILLFYYALATWKKRPLLNEHTYTLHRKSSQIALEAMLIHAILFETVGIHFWIYGKSVILAIILLILNVYSIILIIADIQALRLNPLRVTNNRLYVSLGIMKRTDINWSEISEFIDDPQELEKKLSKTTIDFIARDFEPARPDVILKLKQPVTVIFLMGIEKQYDQVAIRVDNPDEFKKLLITKVSR